MSAPPKFRPFITPDGWCVSVPASLSATGRRVRKFFPSSTAAEKFARSLRSSYARGIRGGLVTQEVAFAAARAMEILAGSGISLVEAARMAMEVVGGAQSTERMADRYLRTLTENESTWSARYLADVQKIPRWIGPAGMRLRCGELTAARVDSLLQTRGPLAATTLENRRRTVLAIARGSARRRRQSAEIRILTLREVGKILRAARPGAQRRAVALLVFAGIRPDAESGEITRLRWENVSPTEVYVPPSVAKTGTDRHIPITPRLRRLLRGHPATGPVLPVNWKRAWQRIRAAAGLADAQDVTRHTFASFFLAAFGDAEAKQAMGHTAGSATLFRHYRRAVRAADGRRFFSVPESQPLRSGD